MTSNINKSFVSVTQRIKHEFKSVYGVCGPGVWQHYHKKYELIIYLRTDYEILQFISVKSTLNIFRLYIFILKNLLPYWKSAYHSCQR